MARLNKKQTINFILDKVPHDLVDIQNWVTDNPEFITILLNHFSCHKVELAEELYYEKIASFGDGENYE